MKWKVGETRSFDDKQMSLFEVAQQMKVGHQQQQLELGVEKPLSKSALEFYEKAISYWNTFEAEQDTRSDKKQKTDQIAKKYKEYFILFAKMYDESSSPVTGTGGYYFCQGRSLQAPSEEEQLGSR